MLLTILSHAVAVLFGAGAVLAYVHKNTAAAVATSNTLAAAINDAKNSSGTLGQLSAVKNIAVGISDAAKVIEQTDKGP
jgi:hypothetical protein